VATKWDIFQPSFHVICIFNKKYFIDYKVQHYGELTLECATTYYKYGCVVTKRERVRSPCKHPDNFYRPSIKPSLWSSPTFVTSASALPQILHDSQPECTHSTSHTRCSHHIHNHHSGHSHKACISFIKIVQRHATPASNGSLTESNNPSRTWSIWAKTLSVYTHLQWPWFATSPSFDNYICIRRSSVQESDAFQIWEYKDQKMRWTHSMAHGF